MGDNNTMNPTATSLRSAAAGYRARFRRRQEARAAGDFRDVSDPLAKGGMMSSDKATPPEAVVRQLFMGLRASQRT
jgi:hypothetical protein